MPDEQTTMEDKGCAPGCCVTILVVGGLVALMAGFTLYKGGSELKVLQRWARGPELDLKNPLYTQEIQSARSADRLTFFAYASLAYLFISWGAIEYWHAVKPQPKLFGKPLNKIGIGANLDSSGFTSWGHPMQRARFAIPITVSVAVYDLALIGAVWCWGFSYYAWIPFALCAFPFNLTALINMHSYLATRAVRAVIPNTVKEGPQRRLKVPYQLGVFQEVKLSIKVVLLGVDYYCTQASSIDATLTHRQECIYRSETMVHPEQELKAGDSVEGEATLQIPILTKFRGEVKWYVAVVAEIQNWPDYETVEKVA